MKSFRSAALEKGGLKSALLLGVVLLGGACGTVPREPRNLQLAKRDAIAYVESGAYQRQIDAVAREASAWLEQRARRGGERLAVVFDVDETVLSNWSQMKRDDFGYISTRWDEWVHAAAAPAIEPMRDVYRTARRLGVRVIFLTGRKESHRGPTERNLRAQGMDEFVAFVCKPDGDRRTAADFKAAERKRLAAAGWRIIANIGDQESDLAGGFAERTFKVPNPFYLTE